MWSCTDTFDWLVTLNDKEFSLGEAASSCGMKTGNTFHIPFKLSLVELSSKPSGANAISSSQVACYILIKMQHAEFPYQT